MVWEGVRDAFTVLEGKRNHCVGDVKCTYFDKRRVKKMFRGVLQKQDKHL